MSDPRTDPPENGAPAHGIAVVGMAGRFPGAPDLERFWENLAAGVESVTTFSAEELRAAGVDPDLLADPAYVRARAVVDGTDLFDAALFEISPREAEVMDPQHRLLLECAWEALERAGYDPARYAGPVGVFAGAGTNTYLLHNLLPSAGLARAVGAYQGMLGSGADFLATRISYKLGLRGPSLTVQTACSTSLVAVHLAVQSLLNGECDMALAGGVRISVPQRAGYLHQPGGILSPDGHCRPFDAAAQGTLDGDGVGLVVLKRLADAEADGDRIHAVILGSAVNNDGDQKVGYTAPSAEGQAEVVAMAQALAGVDPETVTYVETHGTGTPLGDPIEVAALRRAFAASGRRGFCALGSVKGNIGHLDAAAGVASLIKAVLALEHRQLPPSLHFEQPNPRLDLAGGPFHVNARLAEWEADTPRRAGVSSFGIGGTNAHVVLEEAPAAPPGSPSRPRQLLLLSAATASALEAATANLVDHLRRHPDADLADVAYTLQVGRRVLAHRRMVVCQDVEDAVAALGALDPKRVLTRVQEPVNRGVAFLFPGQGAQHPGMAAELYRAEPAFRRQVDLSCDLLRPHLGFDLRPLLFPPVDGMDGAAERLRRTEAAQPALFVIEHALARLWMEWGVVPEAMLGHSIGEYVAACLAGVFSLEDALRLVAARGRLMQELPGGAMLSVSLPEEEVRGLLGDGLALAAVNSPALCVVAGETAAVEALAAALDARGVQHRRLHTSHAFHSPAMEPALERFRARFAGIRLSPPSIPFLSNLTGTWIRPEEAVDPGYWARHLRHTVRFSEGLEVLFRKPGTVLLEVGPGRALSSLARQHPARATGQGVLASLPPAPEAGDDLAFLLRSLGQLWLAGVEVKWDAFHAGERRRRVELPTYPFERRRFWVERDATAASAARPEAAPGERRPLAGWFYVPLWRQTLPVPEADGMDLGPWLVLTDQTGFGERLAARLAATGREVVRVRPGERFERLGEREFAVRPGEAADYRALLAELAGAGLTPSRIAHLWSVTRGDAGGPERILELGFHSLMALAQALGERPAAGPLHLGVVSTGLQRITGGEELQPVKATLLGPAITIPQEYPGVTCQSLDVALPAPGSRRERELIDLLLAELGTSPAAPVAAYRGTDRWVRDWAASPLAVVGADGVAPLRPGGTYLITGGLGGVGLEIAGLLARTARARLVLTGRAAGDAPAETLRRLRELEALGAEILVVSADVTDRGEMEQALARAHERFGPLHGVVHAAGVPGGGLIQRRQRRESEAVLAPKVAGTLALAEAVAGEPLDFLVLCSSLNGLAGGPGQADYAAANAFLDAFAQACAAAGELPVVAVDWDAWREVGMARSARPGGPAPEPPLAESRPFAHPLLRERGTGAEGEVFVSRLRPGESWVLDEHRLGGHPVVPGTVYLEMAEAAFRGAVDGAAGPGTEIRDVLFVAPLGIEDGEEREVRTLIRPEGDGFRFSVRSGAGAGGWQEHAVGSIAAVEEPAPSRFELAALLAGGREEEMGEAYREDLRAAGLGPRWESLRKVWVRDDGVVGLLELAPEFAADLAAFRLHPALLDTATCFAEAYAPRGEGYYLPLSYRRLRVSGALPARFYSYARLDRNGRTAGETLAFDISLLDEEGVERVRIDEFTLKRVDVASTLRTRSAAGPELPAAAGLDEGMSTEEAVEALRRILARGRWPQVAVSTRDLPAFLERARSLTIAELAGKLAGAAAGGYARPDLDTPYVGPRTPLEERLAGLWQEVLGVHPVGVHDDFFELGGHSLLGTQLIARVRDELHAELPLARLFEAPTVAELAAVIAPLAGSEAGAPSRESEVLPIPPRRPEAEPPLSFAQERLWFLDQLQPGLPAYILPIALRLSGPLVVAALERSFAEVARRHGALRSRFPSREGRAGQAIDPPSPFPLSRIDLSGLPEEARRAESARRVLEESRRPFDLAAGPLLRAALLRLDPREHILLVAIHHIVADGWSLGVLVRELGACYESFWAGEAPGLPPLPIQYADYAAWQREWLRGEVLEAQLAYWRRQLGGDLPAIELPGDRPRPAVATFRGGERPFDVGPELLAAVERLGRETRATPFMILLAAFDALLHRYTGQEDLPVGSPIAGRTRRETEPLIGLFVNTLVLRGDLSGDPTVTSLLERVRRTALDAYAHQELPFEKVVDAVQPQRDLSRTPLFQVMFNLRNAPMGALHLPGLELSFFETQTGVASFDLELSLAETPEGLTGAFLYSADLFDAATVERMAEHFRNLLEGMVAGPERRLSELPLLSPPERLQLLGDWTDPGPAEPPAHEQVARQAARAPEAVALVWKGEPLTYGELDRRANALAHRLRALGVAPEARVGLLLDRSPELAVGLLGIWKAGGAFLPLDPDYPRERLDLLLADSGARWVVTRRALAGRLPDGVAGVAVEDLPAAGEPEGAVGAESLAYVIYTSGSTGRPKGVLVEHGNLSRLLQATRRELGWSAADVMPCLAKPSFDIFLFELLSPLAAGGTSVLVPLDPVPDLEEIVTLLESSTRLHAVPALMRQIVDWARVRGATGRHLRTLFVGGDAVPVELLRDLREVFPRAEVRVLYGPTEGTVLATSHRVGDRPERTLIGRPFPGMKAVLKDRSGNLVPVGVAGEIHLGGVGVTRGYLGREDLTRERYVVWEGERWYRTGDLARRLPSGELEFLGRADDQVKIRGVRVEPGEIEAALAEHPKVRESAVVAWGAAGDRRLVAFVVPRDGEIPAGDELRAFLRGRMPEAMVPASFAALDALPLTAHGKVDRRALAARIVEEKRAEEAGPAEPRTLAEATLARIWAAVLRRDAVGVHDNFFELGGDSILSIQIVAQANQAGLRITPRQMFEHQTVAALAAAAGRVDGTLAEQGPVVGPVPLTPVQRRFLAAEPPDPHHFNQAVLLRLRQPLAPAVAARAFAALLRHHDALRLRFVREDGAWRQRSTAPEDAAPFLRLDLAALPPAAGRDELERAAAAVQASLDLAAGPIARAVWIDLPRGEARLLLVVHHLAVDGVSWRILLDDLETACRQLAGGGAVALPLKTTSFRRWAERLEEHVRTMPLEPELSAWLAAGEAGSPLPLDATGENTVALARTVSVRLSEEETRALLQDVPQAYHTRIDDALLAALARTLAGPDGVLRVEVEGHGRGEIGDGIDLSRTVGWFTAAYPVRLAVVPGGDPGDDLKAVKEQLRAVPVHGIGYGLLRYLRSDERAAALLSRQAPPDVSFNYLGQLDQALPEGSLFAPAEEATGSARSPRQRREPALALDGWVAGGRLQVDWTYGEALHRRATVEAWAEEFAGRLRELIAHCGAPEAGGYTPSDFDKVSLRQEDLDNLLAELEEMMD